MGKKYTVSWDMFQSYVRDLAKQLLPTSQWKGIIAVSRGGLFPASILARELGIRHVETISIVSYSQHFVQDKDPLKVLTKPEGDGEGFIIVDDLADSGNTVRELKRLYPKGYIVTVFAKPKGAPLVDKYLIDIAQDTWIEQPWDMAITYVPPLVETLEADK